MQKIEDVNGSAFIEIFETGLCNCKMEPQPLDPKERLYFYQEDVMAVIEYAEPDLPEDESPWRRVSMDQHWTVICWIVGFCVMPLA